MKNLENYGVQELSARDTESIDGGTFYPWYVLIGISVFIESAIDGMIDGIRDGAAQN